MGVRRVRCSATSEEFAQKYAAVQAIPVDGLDPEVQQVGHRRVRTTRADEARHAGIDGHVLELYRMISHDEAP